MDAWQRVQAARNPKRPTSKALIELMIDDFIELHGDRLYGDDPAIVGGIGWLCGVPVTVIGEEKGSDAREKARRNFGAPHPEGYRKALRLMKEAEKFRRPVLCFVDTQGAFCGIGAEERGQGNAIAVNLMEMMRLKTPIFCVIIGEGGSGGALALAVADRVAMLENATYSILTPEGFATILWKDTTLAKNAAEMMKLTAGDLKALNVIDDVIEEPNGDAQTDPQSLANTLKAYFTDLIVTSNSRETDDLLKRRYERFRRMGSLT